MNNKKKLVSGVLSGALAVSMVTPALAATDTSAVIDYERKGTLNIHKMIENDGQTKVSHGIRDEEFEATHVPVDNIGFDYVKIADIANIGGIIISDENGDIDYDADGGMTQVGAFYFPNAAFEEFCAENNIFPAPTYIKSNVVVPTNSLQYEYNDDILEDANNDDFLIDRSEDVVAARDAMNDAWAARRTAFNTFFEKQAAAVTAQTKEDMAQNAKNAAQAKFDELSARSADLAQQLADAQAEQGTATQDLTDAQTALEAAQQALADAKAGDTNAIAALNDAKAAVSAASSALATASQNYIEAQQALAFANENADRASAAALQASAILAQAQADYDKAKTGTPLSQTGAANALAQAQQQKAEADRYLEECNANLQAAQAAFDNAEDALADAKDGLDAALATLTDSQNSSNSNYADLKAAVDALRDAQAAFNQAQASLNTQSATVDKLTAEKNACDADLAAADTALQNAITYLEACTTNSNDADAEAATADADAQAADAAWEAAKEDYLEAVALLDELAAAEGVEKVYTAQAMQDALQQLITTLDEEVVSDWVKNNTDYDLAQAGKYTDDKGLVSFTGLDLGLYIVAETDISYHDGKAGAWNDSADGGFINNDQMNTYDTAGGTYSITPIDAHTTGIKHDYNFGDYYKESVNPEAPVIESLAAPFLVSLPTTNTIATDPAQASNNGTQAGTVWQYTVDVYPKNQSTAIYKRIIDPDEAFGDETLRTSEDYQIGDTVQEIIWADAPKLQKNYLDLENEEAVNKHVSYVISNQMTDGITFDKINKVMILPKSQLLDTADEKDRERMVFINAEGTYVSMEEAVDEWASVDAIPADMIAANRVFVMNADGLLVKATDIPQGDPATAADIQGAGPFYTPKTQVKFFDQNGRVISPETFQARTGVAPADVEFKVDINDEGENDGTGRIYNATEGLTGQYWAERVSCKFETVAASASTVPTSVDAFDIKHYGDTEKEDGIELIAGEDFTIIQTDDTAVTVIDGDGKLSTAVEAGTHGFAVQLTPAGLEKLNARNDDSVVVVFFDVTLNENARIGQTPENMNFPTLHWANTNTSYKHISGNQVFEYTYELQLKKEGVDDATNVKFIVSRTDTGDIAQAAASETVDPETGATIASAENKNMTDVVSGTKYYGQDDSMMFVKEGEGIYHFFDSSSDSIGDVEKTSLTINGITQTFNTITPAADGTLVIRGLDSDSYTFKEIATEAGKNLLADTFTVQIKAHDDALDSLRDGAISEATVSTQNPSDNNGSIPVDITIGLPGIDERDAMPNGNLGIAGMTVTNNDVIDLRTGGVGRMMIYICGVALLGAMAVGFYATKKKEAKDSDVE